MALVELEPLRGGLVGKPGQSGLSVEQRKRLTIAVELVANPSVVSTAMEQTSRCYSFCRYPAQGATIVLSDGGVLARSSWTSPPLAWTPALLPSSCAA